MSSVLRRSMVYRVTLAVVLFVVLLPAEESAVLAGPADQTTLQPQSAKAVGSLTVKIKPNMVRDAGARWRVDGGQWRKSGDLIEIIDVGEHDLSFKRILGWEMPNRRPIVITEGSLSSVTVEYRAKNKYVIELPDGVFLVMVRIPAGSFLMGRYENEQDSSESESPQQAVNIAYSFWMSKYEITKAQWQAVMDTAPWTGRNQVITDPKSPAVYVSWHDAKDFLDRINAHIDDTRQGAPSYRLPSEAEWEYACRANTTTRYYWGDDPDYELIDNYAWWGGNAWDVNERYAHVVGLKIPNPWGLYDMSGNVWEWCEDQFHEDYVGSPADGSSWESPFGPLTRVIRGGSWTGGSGAYCRSSNRGSNIPSGKNSSLGFRIAN